MNFSSLAGGDIVNTISNGLIEQVGAIALTLALSTLAFFFRGIRNYLKNSVFGEPKKYLGNYTGYRRAEVGIITPKVCIRRNWYGKIVLDWTIPSSQLTSTYPVTFNKALGVFICFKNDLVEGIFGTIVVKLIGTDHKDVLYGQYCFMNKERRLVSGNLLLLSEDQNQEEVLQKFTLELSIEPLDLTKAILDVQQPLLSVREPVAKAVDKNSKN
ncbi:hypothetical protein AB1P65_04855 [Roseibium alexandrii]